MLNFQASVTAAGTEVCVCVCVDLCVCGFACAHVMLAAGLDVARWASGCIRRMLQPLINLSLASSWERGRAGRVVLRRCKFTQPAQHKDTTLPPSLPILFFPLSRLYPKPSRHPHLFALPPSLPRLVTQGNMRASLLRINASRLMHKCGRGGKKRKKVNQSADT